MKAALWLAEAVVAAADAAIDVLKGNGNIVLDKMIFRA